MTKQELEEYLEEHDLFIDPVVESDGDDIPL
jgi:hypothetical protein